MTVIAASGSREDQIIAQVLQSALNEQLEADESAPLKAEEIWREDAAGNLTHIQSGAQCPMRWGDYVRERVAVYMPDGTNVGCNYNSRDGRILTFYVYESLDTLADELTGTFDAIKTRQPISEEVRFGAGIPSSAYVARTLAYEQADGTKMRTSVLLADGGPWRLKVRLTCAAANAAQSEEAAGVALMGQADRLESPRPPATATPSPI